VDMDDVFLWGYVDMDDVFLWETKRFARVCMEV